MKYLIAIAIMLAPAGLSAQEPTAPISVVEAIDLKLPTVECCQRTIRKAAHKAVCKFRSRVSCVATRGHNRLRKLRSRFSR